MRLLPKQRDTGVRTIMNLASWSRASVAPPNVSARAVKKRRRRTMAADAASATNGHAAATHVRFPGSVRASSSSVASTSASARTRASDGGVKSKANARKPRRQIPTNRALGHVFEVLKHEWFSHAELRGASVRNLDDIYTRLRAFIAPRKAGGQALPQLYFVAADVKSCYDNIPPDQLLKLLRRVVTDDVYMLRRHAVVIPKPSQGVFRTQQLTSVEPHSFERQKLRYCDIASDLAERRFHHAIFVDSVVEERLTRDEIWTQLKEHLKRNIVLFRGQYYRQRVGIPQGSVLSSLLCNMYYASIMECALGFGDDDDVGDVERKEKALLRMTDDFFFVTTSLLAARTFASTLVNGSAELSDAGCVVNPSKTRLANFALGGSSGGAATNREGEEDDGEGSGSSTDDGGASALAPAAEFTSASVSASASASASAPAPAVASEESRGGGWFPWCGLIVHSGTFNVMADYSRFADCSIRDSINVKLLSPEVGACATKAESGLFTVNGRVAYTLRTKLRHYLKPKCHAVFLDTLINSRFTVCMNVHQLVMVAAIKLACTVDALQLFVAPNARFFAKIVIDAVEFSVQLTKQRTGKRWGVHCGLADCELRWLGLHAFVAGLCGRGGGASETVPCGDGGEGAEQKIQHEFCVRVRWCEDQGSSCPQRG